MGVRLGEDVDARLIPGRRRHSPALPVRQVVYWGIIITQTSDFSK
jgi:hypothetical protein